MRAQDEPPGGGSSVARATPSRASGDWTRFARKPQLLVFDQRLARITAVIEEAEHLRLRPKSAPSQSTAHRSSGRYGEFRRRRLPEELLRSRRHQALGRNARRPLTDPRQGGCKAVER